MTCMSISSGDMSKTLAKACLKGKKKDENEYNRDEKKQRRNRNKGERKSAKKENQRARTADSFPTTVYHLVSSVSTSPSYNGFSHFKRRNWNECRTNSRPGPMVFLLLDLSRNENTCKEKSSWSDWPTPNDRQETGRTIQNRFLPCIRIFYEKAGQQQMKAKKVRGSETDTDTTNRESQLEEHVLWSSRLVSASVSHHFLIPASIDHCIHLIMPAATQPISVALMGENGGCPFFCCS